MIDDVVFSAEMTILRDRFGRQNMTTETIARYLDYLDAKLTTAEFQAAAREIFNRDTFWPSPQRFVEAVRGDPHAAAEEAWNQLMSAAAKGGAPTPEALTTLRALGVTFRDVSTSSEYQLTQLGKRFRAHLERATEPAHAALPSNQPAELEFLK